MAGIRIVPAQASDVPIILEMIKALAEYEQLTHEVVATEDDLRQSLLSSQDSRAQILLRIADDANVTRALRNRAFVTLQYFGYLHRDPEHPGYDLWLRLLDQTGDPGPINTAFLNSIEYRQRF